MNKVSDLRQQLDNLKGRRDQVRKDLDANTREMQGLEQDTKEWEEVQMIIQQVSKLTQEQLRFVIEPPVNQGLASVFDKPYEFELRFETKAGRTWARQIFMRDGHEFRDLLYSGGGGAADVSAFALQIAGLCLTKNRRFLMLDEPLKHLKSKDKSYEERGSLMIQEISHEIGIQIIMISHIPQQQQGSDKVFNFSLKRGKTQVS
jgi:hypothetical protein